MVPYTNGYSTLDGWKADRWIKGKMDEQIMRRKESKVQDCFEDFLLNKYVEATRYYLSNFCLSCQLQNFINKTLHLHEREKYKNRVRK